MNLTQFKRSPASSSPHFMLLGHPVAHSLSPLMHNTAANYYGLEVRYHAVQVKPDELTSLPSALNHEMFRGANVTIPYKQTMMDYVDELGEACRQIGALNTISKEHQRLVGSNTDAYGFHQSIVPYLDEMEGQRVIIFGTGGAARAIVFGLMEAGINGCLMVSRKPDQRNRQNWPANVQFTSYDGWTAFADEAQLFVNATPLGMHPIVQESPVRDSQKTLLGDKICFDIVYRPRETRFLKQAKSVNAQTIDGLEMLIHQGSRSFELWTGKTFPLQKIRDAISQYLNDEH